MDGEDLRRWFAGRDVFAVFAVLVVPLAAGALDSRLMTPLAYPGYLLHALGTAVWNRLFPNLALWVFWAPFLAVSYAVGVVGAALYRAIRG